MVKLRLIVSAELVIFCILLYQDIQGTPMKNLLNNIIVQLETDMKTSTKSPKKHNSNKIKKIPNSKLLEIDYERIDPGLKVRMKSAQHLNYSKVEEDLSLDDIFIGVKTTSKYSDARIALLVKTWFQLAKEQTWFFTDKNNETLQKLTGGRLVNTACKDMSTSEQMSACCKSNAEFDHYISSDKKWLCLFEDDNYVNIPRLLEVLQAYGHMEDWYLGKNCIQRPVRLTVTKYPGRRKIDVSFWFATESAGICISKGLALKLAPLVKEGSFMAACEKILSPSDVTLGFLIEFRLKTNLTIVPQFHSHKEQMKMLDEDILQDQITLSYKLNRYLNESWWNAVKLPVFVRNDPTRFLSLHCFLFPKTDFC